MLNSSQIKEFQKIYKKNFGVYLSTKEARDQGLSLLLLFATIYKPIKAEDLMRYGEKDEKRKKNGSY